jgi:hypothetical protein
LVLSSSRRSRIKKEVQTLPGGELPRLLLLLYRSGPTHTLDLQLPLLQFFDLLLTVFMGEAN